MLTKNGQHINRQNREGNVDEVDQIAKNKKANI